MSNYNNYSFNPRNAKTAREHKPLRWLVKQYFTEPDSDGSFYRHEVWTGYRTDYNISLDKNIKSASALTLAKDNIKRFGGELYADYESQEGPVFVESY